MSAPIGWSADPNELREEIYWSDDHECYRTLFRDSFALHDAKPIWATIPREWCLFEALPAGRTRRRFYVWNEMTGHLLRIRGRWTRETLKEEIDAQGGELGPLGMFDKEEVLLASYDD